MFSRYFKDKLKDEFQIGAFDYHQLFEDFDQDRDGEVDKDEMQAGIMKVFGGKGKSPESYSKSSPFGGKKSKSPLERSSYDKGPGSSNNKTGNADVLFGMIDKEREGVLYLRDFETFVKPYLGSILAMKQLKHTPSQKDWEGFTLAQLSHNLSLELFSKADQNQNGKVEPWEFRAWKESGGNFCILSDLLDYESHFFDKYESVLKRKGSSAGRKGNNRVGFDTLDEEEPLRVEGSKGRHGQ